VKNTDFGKLMKIVSSFQYASLTRKNTTCSKWLSNSARIGPHSSHAKPVVRNDMTWIEKESITKETLLIYVYLILFKKPFELLGQLLMTLIFFSFHHSSCRYLVFASFRRDYETKLNGTNSFHHINMC